MLTDLKPTKNEFLGKESHFELHKDFKVAKEFLLAGKL
jgi:hypothetical protein